MIRRRTSWLCLLLLFAAAAVSVVAEPTAEELAHNRQKLDALRKHPDQLARLRQDLQTFQSLPEARREQIVKLDEQLRHETAAVQARLGGVLERYADWLDRLPEKDRQAIKQAPDAATRLALIHGYRDQEWMRSQPKTYRDEFDKLQGKARSDYVKKLRDDEQRRHQQWQVAGRFWRELESKKPMPCRLSDFGDKSSDKVPRYVTEYLWLWLTPEEKERLTRAEGLWPEYPQALVEIASKYPSALPPPKLPTHPDKLPAPILARVTVKKEGSVAKGKLIAQLKAFESREEFASKVVEIGTRKGLQPFEFEFWACNYKSLSKPMQEFVETKLKPRLKDNQDKKRLLDNEGSWPYYPLTIQELSQQYHLRPPWHILPEAEKWKWDQYRMGKCSS